MNMVSAATHAKQIKNDQAVRLSLNNMILIFKLLLIPFCVFNFALWFMTSAAFMVLPGFQVFLFAVPFAVIYAYLMICVSSAYAIVSMSVQYHTGNITRKRYAVNIVMQFLFVLDVIGYIFMYKKIKKAVAC